VRRFLIGLFGALLVGALGVTAASFAVGAASDGSVMPGVRVGGIALGGLTSAEAAERLRAELPALGGGGVVVSVDGREVRLANDELARAYDVEAMVRAAYAVARSGDPLADALDRLRVLTAPRDLPLHLKDPDVAALDRAVASLVDRFSADPRDAEVRRRGSEGFVVRPAIDGARLDADELRAALSRVIRSASPDPARIELATDGIPPALTTAAAEEATREANAMTARALVLRADDERFRLRPVRLRRLIDVAVTDGAFTVTIDRAALREVVKPLGPKLARSPLDAWFAEDGGRIVGVIPGRDGLRLDVRRSVSAIVGALEARVEGGRGAVSLVVDAVAPAVPTDAAGASVPRLSLLGTWTTYYQPGEGNFWNANIHIPAWDLDGHVVSPGEWFSFWNDIGPVTEERGYGYGGVILGGRSVANGALAGGICSTSTTLFNAAMRAGLDIGQRVNHSYYIERYPVGLDATVLMTPRSVTDMTFRNDTANPVVIRSYTGNGWVRFDIWGVPDGRTVSLSAPLTSNHIAAIDTVVVNPDLAPGTSVRVEYPHNGFTAVVTRTVRAAGGAILHADLWRSYYRVVNGITEVGPAA
jgi:vancomycin resistance protein YoaR